MKQFYLIILVFAIIFQGEQVLAQCTTPLATISSNVSICSGQSTNLTITLTKGKAPWSVTYNDGAVNISVSGIPSLTYTLTASPAATTTYSLKSVTDSLGCINDTLKGKSVVTVNARPTAQVTGVTDTVCIGGAKDITGTITANGNWTLSLTPEGTATGSGNSFSITVNPSANTTYKIASLSDANCFSFPIDFSGSQTVDVTTPPFADKPADQIICAGDSSAEILFTGNGNKKKYSWKTDHASIGLSNIDSTLVSSIPKFKAINNTSLPIIATITVTPKKGGCEGLPVSFTITVNPTPTAAIINLSDTSVCAGSTALIKISVVAAGDWTLNLAPSGIMSGTGNGSFIIPVTPVSNTTYSIASLTTSFCAAVTSNLTGSKTVTVNEIPVVDQPTSQTVCNNVNTAAINFTGTSSTIYNWINDQPSIGLAATGSGNILSFIAVNTGTIPIVANITVTPVKNGCTGTSKTFSITVNPKLKANILSSDASVCNGSSTDILVDVTAEGTWVLNLFPTGTTTGIGSGIFPVTVSPVANTTYTISSLSAGSCPANAIDLTGTETVTLNPALNASITSSNASICNGTSTNILGSVTASGDWILNLSPSGTASGTNSGTFNIPVSPSTTTTYQIVSLSAGTCNAISSDLLGIETVTVNPLPAASITSADAGICNGQSTIISGSVSAFGTWEINLSPSGTASGNGDGSFTISVSPSATTTYSVSSLSAGTCFANAVDTMGTEVVTVNEVPTVFQPSNVIVCNGEVIPDIIFSGSLPNTNFKWVNDKISIGLASNGTGNILSFTATNNGTVDSIATIIVTPDKGGCYGTATTFTITVRPTPVLNSNKNFVICNNLPFVYQATSATAGTTFHWERDVVAGISNSAAMADSNLVNEILNNTTAEPVTVIYKFQSTANGCASAIENVIVIVNPTPLLTSSVAETICSDSVFNYAASCATNNVQYEWNRAVAYGISNSANGESDNTISETLFNTTDSAQQVTYVFTLTTADGLCSSQQILLVNVFPSPKVDSVTDKYYCDGDNTASIKFSSKTPDSKFYWKNNNTSIGLSAMGSDSIPSFIAINNTALPVNAIISVYAVTDVGDCAGEIRTFSIIVNPKPTLTSSTEISICSGNEVNYLIEASFTNSVLYSWNSAPVLFITGNGNQGEQTDNLIPDLLLNSLNDQVIPVFYNLSLTYKDGLGNSCKTDTTIIVNVNPPPPAPLFSSLLSSTDTVSICEGSENINFNINQPYSSSGVTYQWSSSPETGINIRNTTNPNTVISFYQNGVYQIKVTAYNSVDLGSCPDSVSQTVIVQNISDTLEERKIFMQQPGNLLVYPDNSLAIDSGYQWGYDLRFGNDSLGVPDTIPGQVYQVFIPESKFITAEKLDTNNYCFWVLLKESNGCRTKVYYNGPYAPLKLAEDAAESVLPGIKIYPNPNSGSFNVTVFGKIYGNIDAKIYNPLGELLYESTFLKKQNEATLRIENLVLPEGIYMITLLSSDHQKLNARIIISN